MEKGLLTLLILLLSALPAMAVTDASGPWGINIASFTSLSTAKRSPTTAGKTMVVTKTMNCNNLTIPVDRPIEVKKGGRIRYSGNLVINAPFTAGLYYALESVGSGTLTFGAGAVEKVLPQWFGLDGINDSVAIQKAVDAAQVPWASVGGIGAPDVFFLAGTYHLITPLIKKRARWMGQGANNTQFIWDGSTSAVAIYQDVVAGLNSATNIEAMSFYAGGVGFTNKPDIWLQIPASVPGGYGADVFYRLRELRFRGVGSYHIDLMGFMNTHWSHLRFDSWDKFAIRIRMAPGHNQFLSTFNLDNFTADHMVGSSGEGFLLLDNTEEDQSWGTVRIANGRIESNSPFTGRKGIVVQKIGPIGYGDFCDLQLQSVTIQDTTGSDAASLVHIDNGGVANKRSKLMLRNVSVGALTSIFGGDKDLTWGASSLPLKSYQDLSVTPTGTFGAMTDSTGENGGLQIFTDNAAGKLGFSVHRAGEAWPRVKIGSDGVLLLGNGTAAPIASVRPRITGWAAPTGLSYRTAFDASSVTVGELAQRVHALIDDLTTHGLIGP